MFKIFRNNAYLYAFAVFFICFASTLKCNAGVIKDRFQYGENTIIAKGNTDINKIDMAVIYDTGEQDEFSFGKVEKVSILFSAIWGGFGIISLLVSLASGNPVGTMVSIASLFVDAFIS
ncbi:hypothetical protein [Bartonella sp. B41]